LRGQEAAAARQEAMQQPASKQEANGSEGAATSVHHQNTIQQSNEMEVLVDVRCWRVQVSFASKKSNNQQGFAKGRHVDHGVDKARKKRAQRGGSGKDCRESNNDDRDWYYIFPILHGS
jgi:hypothetical protein